MDLITPTEAQRLLADYGLAPRKSAGQNFVIDPNTVRRIVREAGVQEGGTVLEIGPGLGSLTRALLETAGRVIAVEIDRGFVEVLHATIDDDRLAIVHDDAMAVDIGALVRGEDGLGGPAILVANLPYNLATPLVAHSLEAGDAISSMYVMVQKEVGQRWAARPGDKLYAGISVKLALVADVAVDINISRQVFLPVPNVDSVMVRIKRRADAPALAEVAGVWTVIETAFSQRRKTLRRTLRALAPVEQVEAACAAAGIDPGERPEQLSPAQFVALAEHLLAD
jgi:16S rRNA (adenine1518-N6/adenine1519-N6)-dimethyltransferase